MRCAVVAVASAVLLMTSPGFVQAAPLTLAQYLVRVVTNAGGGKEMLVAGRFDPQAQLPAQIRLSVPKGATIDWVGEILGGPTAQDPSDKYTIEPGRDFDTVVFTLTKARQGQVELKYPAGLVKRGGATVSGFDFVPAMPAAIAELGVEVPQGAKVSNVTPGAALQPGGQGITSYAKSFSNVKIGQKLSLSLQYSGGTTVVAPQTSPQAGAQPPAGVAAGVAGGAAAGQTAGSTNTLPIAIIVLGLIVAATFVMLDRVGRRTEAQAPTPARTSRSVKTASAVEEAEYFDDEPAPPPSTSRKPAAKRTRASKHTTRSAKA